MGKLDDFFTVVVATVIGWLAITFVALGLVAGIMFFWGLITG